MEKPTTDRIAALSRALARVTRITVDRRNGTSLDGRRFVRGIYWYHRGAILDALYRRARRSGVSR